MAIIGYIAFHKFRTSEYLMEKGGWRIEGAGVIGEKVRVDAV